MARTFALVLMCFLLHRVSSHTNPCPQFWQYKLEGGNYQGRVTIHNPPIGDQIKIRLVLSISGSLPTEYEGAIELLNDDSVAVRNIFAGRNLVYKVLFPVQNPLPVLLDLRVNGRSLCQGYPAHGSINTNIKLFHILDVNQSPAQPQFQSPTQSQYQSPAYAPQPQGENRYDSSDGPTNFNNQICGQTYDKAVGLVVNGHSFRRGEWPWLVALYFRNEFICGGTLVTNSHVITAAHCIHNKDDHRKRVGDMYFILGGHNLNEQDNVRKTISTFITHPDWDPSTEKFDADIALAAMSSGVQFTKFIRPACLYVPGVHPESIAGRPGTLAGWGRRLDKILSVDDPQMTSIPVVTNEECLRSNSVFAKVTSPRTFCAGSKDGRGPCSGDSGGGFLVAYNGKWVLRGIVSASLKGTEIECNVHEYMIFTDVSKFASWIRSYIE